MTTVKTAISVPDSLFESGEKLARELEISRSQLYQRALADYIGKLSDERAEFIAQVNEVCEQVDMGVDSELYSAQLECLPLDEEW